MNQDNTTHTKYTLVLKPLANQTPELLKKLKATLLTAFNLQIYEIQNILENLPAEIFSCDNIEEISAKQIILLNIGANTTIEQGDFSQDEYLARESKISEQVKQPADGSATKEDPNNSQATSTQAEGEEEDGLSVSTEKKSTSEGGIEEILEESAEQNSEGEPNYFFDDTPKSIWHKLRDFHDRYHSLIDGFLDVLPMIIFGATVLFFTNLILQEEAVDPTIELNKKIQELQKKRIQIEQFDLVEARDNETYTFNMLLSLYGEKITKTSVSILYKTQAEPNAEAIILGKEVPSFIRSITIDSDLPTDSKDLKLKSTYVAKVEVEKAYQLFSEYVDASIEGVFSSDRKSFTGEISIAHKIDEPRSGEVSKADVATDGTIKALFNMPVTLAIPVVAAEVAPDPNANSENIEALPEESTPPSE